jgi:hypothetical protein
VDIAVRGEDPQGVADLLGRLVHQLDVAPVGLVAQELHAVVDHLTHQVAVGEGEQLAPELIGQVPDMLQIRLGGLLGRLGRFLRLFQILHEVVVLHRHPHWA